MSGGPDGTHTDGMYTDDTNATVREEEAAMWRCVRNWTGTAWEAMRTAARRDAGMNTAEYAMGTIAACAFAAVLYKVVTSDAVSSGVQAVIGRALDAPF